MSISSLVSHAALGLGLLSGLSAHAAYLKWETIELPASSGASCGNGSPYRFFVNRSPCTTKTVVMFEGGGPAGKRAPVKTRVARACRP